MKYLRMYGEVNDGVNLEKIKVGYYVILLSTTVVKSERYEDKIGKVIYVNHTTNYMEVDFDGIIIKLSIFNVKYWSKSKKELELYLAAKKYNLSEKVQSVKPKMGQYIFETYLSDLIKVNPKIHDTPPGENNIYFNYLKSYYKIEYEFNRSYNYSKEDFIYFLDIIKSVEQLCTDVKNQKGVDFRFYENTIILNLIISASKIDEIKSTKEYQGWLNLANIEFSKYKENQKFRKDIKKYNL